MKTQWKRHLWVILLLFYLLLCVLSPYSLRIDAESCHVGSAEIGYVVRNRSILPAGPARIGLEQLTGTGWTEIEDAQLRYDVGYTFGLLDADRGSFVSAKPLEAGRYRLTVRCNYSLLGKIEKTEEFVID